jgi:putative hydroxymethylpyrimidine transport system substrate-binding protein
MKGFSSLALLLVFAGALVGCGGGGSDEAGASASSQEGVVKLHALAGPDDLAILMAQKQGFFEKAGLDVQLAPPVSPDETISAVANGEDDLGIVQMPQLVLAKEEGSPVVAVASVVPLATATIIWSKASGARMVAELKGKTIGVTGIPYQEGFLESALARHGLSLQDVQIKQVGSQLVPALREGRVDAIFGGALNKERVELEAEGPELTIKSSRVLGIPPYEEFVLIAKPSTVAEDPKLVRDFVTAMASGVEAATEDPQTSADLVTESESPAPDPTVVKTQVEATLGVLSRTGEMEVGFARRLVDWMYEQHMIEEKVPLKALMTKAYRE